VERAAAEEVLDLVVVLPAETKLDAHGPSYLFQLVSSTAIEYARYTDGKHDILEDRMSTALAAKLHEITDTLSLSQEDVGWIVGATARSVSRWAGQEAVPQRLSRQRLIELAYVAEAVREVMQPKDANLWLMSPNRLLDHDSPADRIRAGDYRSVLGLLDALADGIVV
jgi:hypothetical protein